MRTARCFPETVICLKRTVGGGRTVRVVLTVDGRNQTEPSEPPLFCCLLWVGNIATCVYNLVLRQAICSGTEDDIKYSPATERNIYFDWSASVLSRAAEPLICCRTTRTLLVLELYRGIRKVKYIHTPLVELG